MKKKKQKLSETQQEPQPIGKENAPRETDSKIRKK